MTLSEIDAMYERLNGKEMDCRSVDSHTHWCFKREGFRQAMGLLVKAGVWHQGETEEESDYFPGPAFEEQCAFCIQLYRIKEPK